MPGTSYFDKVRQEWGDAGYRLTDEEVVEESVAEMARHFYAGRLGASPEAKNLIARLVQGLRRIGAAILGTDTEGVLRRLENGDLARQAGVEMPVGSARYRLTTARRKDAPISDPTNPAFLGKPLTRDAAEGVVPGNTRTYFENYENWKDKNGPGTGKLTQADLDAIFAEIDEANDGKLTELMTPGEDGAFRPLSLQMLSEAMSLPMKDLLWYEDWARSIGNYFDLDAGSENRLINLTSAQSQNTRPEPNIEQAVANLAENEQGKANAVGNTAPSSVGHALTHEHMDTVKFYNFSNTVKHLLGRSSAVPGPTLDLIMGRIFGWNDGRIFSDPAAQKAVSQYVTRLIEAVNAQHLNRPPLQAWHLQAGLWIRRRIDDGNAMTGSSYLDHMPVLIEKLRKAGVPLSSEGKINAETLRDPKVITVLGQTADSYAQQPWIHPQLAAHPADTAAQRLAQLGGIEKKVSLVYPGSQKKYPRTYEQIVKHHTEMFAKQVAKPIYDAVLGKDTTISRVVPGSKIFDDGSLATTWRMPTSILHGSERVQISSQQARQIAAEIAGTTGTVVSSEGVKYLAKGTTGTGWQVYVSKPTDSFLTDLGGFNEAVRSRGGRLVVQPVENAGYYVNVAFGDAPISRSDIGVLWHNSLPSEEGRLVPVDVDQFRMTSDEAAAVRQERRDAVAGRDAGGSGADGLDSREQLHDPLSPALETGRAIAKSFNDARDAWLRKNQPILDRLEAERGAGTPLPPAAAGQAGPKYRVVPNQTDALGDPLAPQATLEVMPGRLRNADGSLRYPNAVKALDTMARIQSRLATVDPSTTASRQLEQLLGRYHAVQRSAMQGIERDIEPIAQAVTGLPVTLSKPDIRGLGTYKGGTNPSLRLSMTATVNGVAREFTAKEIGEILARIREPMGQEATAASRFTIPRPGGPGLAEPQAWSLRLPGQRTIPERRIQAMLAHLRDSHGLPVDGTFEANISVRQYGVRVDINPFPSVPEPAKLQAAIDHAFPGMDVEVHAAEYQGWYADHEGVAFPDKTWVPTEEFLGARDAGRLADAAGGVGQIRARERGEHLRRLAGGEAALRSRTEALESALGRLDAAHGSLLDALDGGDRAGPKYRVNTPAAPQAGPDMPRLHAMFPHLPAFEDAAFPRAAGDAAAVVDAHGVVLPRTTEQVLSRVRVGNKRLLDVAAETWDDASELRALAQADRNAPLQGVQARRLADLQKRLNPDGLDMAAAPDDQVGHVVRESVRRQWHDVMPDVGSASPEVVQRLGAGFDRLSRPADGPDIAPTPPHPLACRIATTRRHGRNPDAEDHGRRPHVPCTGGDRGGPADLRRLRQAAAVPPDADPGPLERRVRLGAAGGPRCRHRRRERDLLPGPRRNPPLPRRLQRDGDSLPLRRDLLRQQARPARRQPLPDHRRGERRRPAEGGRPPDPLGGRAGNPLRARRLSESLRAQAWPGARRTSVRRAPGVSPRAPAARLTRRTGMSRAVPPASPSRRPGRAAAAPPSCRSAAPRRTGRPSGPRSSG